VHHAALPIGSQACEQSCGIHRVESVLRAAKIATHFDLTLFGNDALDLFSA
jgi:hypothetical protein